MLSKKGQIGQTMTWIFATIIVIVLTFLFIYVSGEIDKINFTSSDSLNRGDSKVVNQQMLFAILNKEFDGKSVSDMIKAKDKENVERNVKLILDDFSNKGINCSFYVNSLDVGIDGDGEGTPASIDVDDIEVSLWC